MIFLLFSIISSTIIAVVFKIQNRLEIKLFPIIVINYFAATFLGISLTEISMTFSEILSSNWIFGALFIGALLIAGFYLIGYSTKKIGIAITTISNKMSVVLPMLFSIIAYNELINEIKIIGIFLALFSVFMSVYKKRKRDFELKYIYLPILLFFTIGIIDSIIKFAQYRLIETQIPVFTAISFGISGVVGVILSFFNNAKLKDFINPKTTITGIILGSANFGSMYFLILALNKSGLDSSVVFGVNHIGIISLSVLIAFFIFKEKLKLINWIGVVFSIIAIIILTGFYKKIITFFV